MGAGALRTATDTFALTRTEIAALESAGAGEALLLCAAERQLISLLTSDKEKELFTTTPAELATRNRHRRASSDPPARPVMERPATQAAANQRSGQLADLFDDVDDVDATSPVPLQAFRRRAHP
jgi:hypothetical protein